MTEPSPALRALGAALQSTELHSLPLIARGKVRDLYAVGTDRMLMVASDRLRDRKSVCRERVYSSV